MTIKDAKTVEFMTLARAKRKGLGLKQFAISSELGITVSKLSDIERNKQEARVSHFLKMCNALGVETTCYYREDDELVPVITQEHLDRCELPKLLKQLRTTAGVNKPIMVSSGVADSTMRRIEKGADVALSVFFRYLKALGLVIEFKGV